MYAIVYKACRKQRNKLGDCKNRGKQGCRVVLLLLIVTFFSIFFKAGTVHLSKLHTASNKPRRPSITSTCHVLIRTPLVVPRSVTFSTSTSETWAHELFAPRLPMLQQQTEAPEIQNPYQYCLSILTNDKFEI